LQRIWLSVVGIMSVAMGMILAYGLCSLFGLFYSAAHTVIPFLLLGIGIDNIFVITQVFKMFYLFLTLSYSSKIKGYYILRGYLCP
jgi:hypothetical protein